MIRGYIIAFTIGLLGLSVEAQQSKGSSINNTPVEARDLCNSCRFPVWIVFNSSPGPALVPRRNIYIFMQQDDFTEDRLKSIFTNLAGRYSEPVPLSITAYSDKDMLERVIQIKELPVDVDFAKTPEGRKEEAKYYDELLPRGRIYHEAYFYRSSSGEEKFQYNPDAKESKFVVVKLKDKTDEDYTGNINNDLILAARKGDTEYIQNLIIRGADINSTDFQGNTALMDAKNLESARILLKVKIDVNLQNKYGATALIKAADRDAREIVDLLLQNGAKINLKDRYGYTALMTAARNGHVSIVAMLIKKGANGTVANNIGQTALTLAREKGYSKIVQLLESSGIFQ